MHVIWHCCYTRQQLAEIIRAQNELKELAKRLQYYDDEVEQEEEGSPDLQVGTTYVQSFKWYNFMICTQLVILKILVLKFHWQNFGLH